MVFSSQTFLFAFLPLALLCLLVRRRSVQNALLLLASLVFYAWGEPVNVLLMCLSALVAWLGGLWQERLAAQGRTRTGKAVYLITVGLILGNLFVFKYLNFFCENLWFLGVSSPNILLPVGISFYTFQVLSYVIDLRRGEIGVQRNYFYLLMYVSFFPQLIAGPIVRYETIEQEILDRSTTLADIAAGFRRFVVGLAKKLLLANQVALVAQSIYAGGVEAYSSGMYWVAALAYAMQIYFDFSGYSDMAIGLGRMFGFHFLENFNYPYTSLSVTEFWRRWHISLSTWFRDYVYIPLGGNRTTKAKWLRNILIVWALTGFWHGAQWNFVLWGLYYGLILVIEKLWLGKWLERCPKLLRWCYCAVLVCIGWVMFNLTDFQQMLEALGHMFSFRAARVPEVDVSMAPGLLWMLPAAVACTPVGKKVQLGNGPAATLLKNGLCVALLLVCLMYCISASFNPFIYFRF